MWMVYSIYIDWKYSTTNKQWQLFLTGIMTHAHTNGSCLDILQLNRAGSIFFHNLVKNKEKNVENKFFNEDVFVV